MSEKTLTKKKQNKGKNSQNWQFKNSLVTKSNYQAFINILYNKELNSAL
jgi:hypothetical protein